MDIDLTPLVTGAITVAASVCTAFVVTKLVPEIKKLFPSLADKRLADEAFWNAEIEKAINGVEKKFGPGQGDLKLPAALAYLQKQAKRYGFYFDAYVVDTLVHVKLKEIDEKAAAALAGKS